MKAIKLSALAASLVLALPAFADETPAAGMPDARMMQQMQGNLATMQKQLERLGKARTAEERQKIMAEHMLTMQQSMGMARDMQYGTTGCPMLPGDWGMMGPGMMGGGMGMGPGMMGYGRAGSDDMLARRLEMMERRMDMMQMMMQGGIGMQPGAPVKPAN